MNKFPLHLLIGCVLSAWAFPLQVRAQVEDEIRTWVSQEGTTLKAKLLEIKNANVVLQNETGTTFNVPISRLSLVDQTFLRTWAQQHGLMIASESQPAPVVPVPAVTPTPAPEKTAELTSWPVVVSVDFTKLDIVNGEQNAAERRFVYRSGAFQFTSQAPLTGTVMRDVARDFELVKTLFQTFPWNWEPAPKKNEPFYLAELYETEEDYIKSGGGDNSSGWSKDNLILTKFKSLGLKKVGGKYAKDPKSDDDGSLVSLICRLVMGDMRDLCMPWSAMGLEEFLESAAYRNGLFNFPNPERAIKARVNQVGAWGAETDAARMVEFLHTPWSEYRDNSVDIRRQFFLDGMLLVYFFGYLDDDGKGTRLHQYYRAVAQEAMSWRNASAPRNRGGLRNSESALKHNQILLAGRSKEQLQKEITEKFKTIGLKIK